MTLKDKFNSEILGPITPADYWMHSLRLRFTPDELAKIPKKQRWIVESFIPGGHITAVVAPGGVGKTSILVHALSRTSWAADVTYMHWDASDMDVHKFHHLYDSYPNFNYICPAYKPHYDVATFWRELKQMESDFVEDYRGKLGGVCVVIDTLSQVVDVNNKPELKGALTLLKRIKSLYGMSFVLVAHTNKHKGSDDRWVYEGAGDLFSVCDNLIYLDYLADECSEDIMAITTRVKAEEGGKARAPGIHRQWRLDRKTRDVTDFDLLKDDERAAAHYLQEVIKQCDPPFLRRRTAVELLKQEFSMGRDRVDALIKKGPECGLWMCETGDNNETILAQWVL